MRVGRTSGSACRLNGSESKFKTGACMFWIYAIVTLRKPSGFHFNPISVLGFESLLQFMQG